MILSILICSIPSREAVLKILKNELESQAISHNGVEILIDADPDKSIGKKRNDLLELASGKYLCFHDDDDWPSYNYINLLMEAAKSKCDCASLKGVYYVDGRQDGLFEHSLKYNEWKTTGNEIKYERFPNHLNCVKASIAKQFKFPEKNFGEDHDWSTQIHKSGLLKTEHYIPEIIYYYNFVSKK